MNITYNDITARMYAVKSTPHSGDSLKPRIYTDSGKFCSENAVNAIYNWEHLAETTDEAFDKALDIFEEVCMNENDSNIQHIASFLQENVKKVRDASKLQNSIKYRNSRLKSKISTKINNKRDTVTNAIKNSLAQINHNLTASPLTATSAVPQNSAKGNEKSGEAGVAESCFNQLYAEATRCKECDRVIANYNKVSNRFNLDRIITEAVNPADIYPAVWDIAWCMDTYQIPFKKKYSCALENAYYVLNKYHMHYPQESIIEAVTDYFIFTSGLTESQLADIASVKKNSVLFEFTDFNDLDFLYEDDASIDDIEIPNEDTAEGLTESYGVEFGFLTEDASKAKQAKKQAHAIKLDLKKSTKKLVKDAKKGNPDERMDPDVKDMIDDFRKQCAKDPDNKNNVSRLKALVTNLFTRTPYQIIYELPNLFSLIRVGFIITATAITPILGVVSLITDQIVRMTLERKQMDKLIDAYKKEIDSVKAKIEKTKDPDTKENLEKYQEELKKDLDKLKTHADSLYTDEENDERHADDWEDMDFDFGDDDDFDINWDDDEFEEAANIVLVSELVQSIAEQLVDDKDLDGVVFGNIFKLDNDCLDAVTDFSVTVPVILEKEKLCETLKDYREQVREQEVLSVDDYIRIDCLNDNIAKLENSAPVYNTSNDLKATVGYLTCLNEMVKLDCDDSYVIEAMSFSNTIKLAIDRLKKTAVKLSDKEKQTSQSIDVAASQVAKGMERAMMNDNREAIIRGSVIPSASKCIKTALGLGVAWAINPAIAVIGALGTFACQKKMQKKERQLVLDEIEIELKMTERYIQQAENEGDMKKLRQLEMTQRNLQRQHQRIKYSMHVYHDRIPEPHGKDD